MFDGWIDVFANRDTPLPQPNSSSESPPSGQSRAPHWSVAGQGLGRRIRIINGSQLEFGVRHSGKGCGF